MQQAQVGGWFESDFNCDHALTAVEPGGYAVQGCGVTAHYRCLSHRSRDLFDSHPGECFLAGSDDEEERMPRLPPAAPVSVRQDAKLGVIVRGRAEAAPGMQLMALGAPLREPHKVVLELHTLDRVVQGSCNMRMFRDGKPLSVLQAESLGSYDLRLIVDVAGFASAQSAARIAGEGCGIDFELGEDSRQMLGVFAARFQEELLKTTPPKS